MNTGANTRNTPIRPLTGIAYALPVVPVLVLMASNNVLSGIYATYHGLTLASIAMVMLIAGLFDAVTDPSIGYLSDRYHARTGSRRPFVVVGALLIIPSAWFLLNPAEGVTITYFLVWYLLFYLAVTLFQIPHLTWGGEISPVSEDKTKIYGYRNYAGFAGLIVFSLIPLLPFTEGSKVTPDTMRLLVIVAAVLLLPTLAMMQRYVPATAHSADQAKIPENPFRAMRALVGNKPLMWFLAASTLFNFASAFYIGLKFMAMDAYLGLGDYYVHLLLFHQVVATLAIKPAIRFIERVGKVKAWTWAIALAAMAYLSFPLVLLNNTYVMPLFLLFYVVFSLSSAIGNTATFALLSDVSDYGTLRSGVDRSATCFSLQSLTIKSCLAIGISLSIALAGALGFDPTAITQDTQMYWALSLCMGFLPAVLAFLGAACVPMIGISSERHAIIRRRLAARAARGLREHSETQISGGHLNTQGALAQ